LQNRESATLAVKKTFIHPSQGKSVIGVLYWMEILFQGPWPEGPSTAEWRWTLAMRIVHLCVKESEFAMRIVHLLCVKEMILKGKSVPSPQNWKGSRPGPEIHKKEEEEKLSSKWFWKSSQ
jgi:hypothetical protein